MVDTAAQQAAAAEAASMPIEAIDPSDEKYFVNDTIKHYLARLRRDAPVHWVESPNYGGYWSITKFDDIMKVDTNWKTYSSDFSNGGIMIMDVPNSQGFISTDPPVHNVQRKSVENTMAPANLANLESLVRERTERVLDGLPRGEVFDWVPEVSKTLTALMLGTLFDLTEEESMNIPVWTEKIISFPGIHGRYATFEEKYADLQPIWDFFAECWERKRHEEPKFDLISMLVHNPKTQNMSRTEFEANLRLLIVGGNDTTRNSMTSGLIQMKENPEEYAKIKAKPELIENMVSELIRWQTPLAHMRRTATEDIEIRGKKIKAGDKVVMWYLSGNFDEEKIENADKFMIERPHARQHLSFGFGLHRCLGNRVAELQLRILWEEFLKRFDDFEIIGEPVFSNHNFVRGFDKLMVKLPA